MFPALVREAHARLKGGLLKRVTMWKSAYSWEEHCVQVYSHVNYLKISIIMVMLILFMLCILVMLHALEW